MNGITSHVLDTALGRPVTGLSVSLARLEGGVFRELSQTVTDHDGRIKQWSAALSLTVGVYRLTFATGAHYEAAGQSSFYEQVEIQFRVIDASAHYHVPLLLSPFGYTTYRGS